MTTELVPTQASASAHPEPLFAGSPPEVISAVTEVADQLHQVITAKRLAVTISGREHVRVEGWQLGGVFVGVAAVKDSGVVELPWPGLLPQGEGTQARAVRAARDQGLAYGFTASYRAVKDGREVGWGEGRVTRAETNW